MFNGRVLSVPKTFKYKVGDCLFDSIAHLTGEKSSRLRIVSMEELQRQRLADTQLFRDQKPFFNNLFKGSGQQNVTSVRNLDQYIDLMKKTAAQGGLWGDSVCCIFLEEHLKCKIWVWSTISGTSRQDSNRYPAGAQYHILYHDGGFHYEPLL